MRGRRSNRFEIQDRKGLEIVILTALMTFVDATREGGSGAAAPSTPIVSSSAQAAAIVGVSQGTATMQNVRPSPHGRQGSGTFNVKPPALPSKPAPKTGVDRIAEIQAGKGEYNEIIVEEEGSVEDYGELCTRLLQVC